MIKLAKFTAFVLFGIFIYGPTASYAAPNTSDARQEKELSNPTLDTGSGYSVTNGVPCCKNGVLSTCPHPGYDYKGNEMAYDISACQNFSRMDDYELKVNPSINEPSINDNLLIERDKLCLSGSVYNPVTKQCEYTCEDGTKVTSLSNCPVKKECETGHIQYQPCDKNGVNCGTQERACSNNKWTAWSSCKVL